MTKTKFLIILSIFVASIHSIYSIFLANDCEINRGVAFGMLSDSFWLILVLSIVLVLSILAMVFVYKKPIYLAIIPPAFSNLLDRVVHGGVCDYIHLEPFTIFNVNDMFITSIVIISVVYLIYDFKNRK